MNQINFRARSVVVLALLFLLVATSTKAQDATGFVPWPLLLEGPVYVDEQPITEGAVIVHIGDWESAPQIFSQGYFDCARTCLVVGPPTASYAGKIVSFELVNVGFAEEMAVFQIETSPIFRDQALHFVSSPETQNSFAAPKYGVIAGAIFAIVMLAIPGWRLFSRNIKSTKHSSR